MLMRNLILVNGFFAGVLVLFILLPITSNWAWLALIAIWCWTEGVLSKNPDVKWWQMVLVFLVLGLIDFSIVYYAAVN